MNGDTCAMLSAQSLKMIGLLLASYRTDSIPCGQGTCAPTTAHACTSPQLTVVPDGPGHRRAATSLLVERRMPRRSVPSVKKDMVAGRYPEDHQAIMVLGLVHDVLVPLVK